MFGIDILTKATLFLIAFFINKVKISLIVILLYLHKYYQLDTILSNLSQVNLKYTLKTQHTTKPYTGKSTPFGKQLLPARGRLRTSFFRFSPLQLALGKKLLGLFNSTVLCSLPLFCSKLLA
jgi:hypothetical protein